MPEEREAPVEPHEVARAFNRQKVWRRILIVAAGPVFNFIFAILVYAGLFMYGLPEARPVIAAPPAGTLAAQAGLASGDTVRSIGGAAVSTWQDLRWQVLQAARAPQAGELETENERSHPSTGHPDLRGLPP